MEARGGESAEVLTGRRTGPIGVLVLLLGVPSYLLCLHGHADIGWGHRQEELSDGDRLDDLLWVACFGLSLVFARLLRRQTVAWRRFGRVVLGLFVLRVLSFLVLVFAGSGGLIALAVVWLVTCLGIGWAAWLDPPWEPAIVRSKFRRLASWAILLSVLLGTQAYLYHEDPGRQGKLRTAAIRSLNKVAREARIFRYRSGKWPASLEELRNAGSSLPTTDPWNRGEFTFHLEGDGVPVIGSLGKFGEVGGKGFAADLHFRVSEHLPDPCQPQFDALIEYELQEYLKTKPLQTLSGRELASLLSTEFHWAPEPELERALSQLMESERLRSSPVVAEAWQRLSSSDER